MSLLRKRKVKISDGAGGSVKQTTTQIAQEMYRKNVELAHTNQTLSLLRTIDALVLETDNSLEDLIQGIANALVNNTGYLYSAVFMKKSASSVHFMGLGGFASSKKEVISSEQLEQLESLKVEVDADWLESGKNIEILSSKHIPGLLKRVFGSNFKPLLSLNSAFDSETMCVVKLAARKKPVGLLVIGLLTEAHDLHIRELEYLGRVGEASGIAIDNKLLFEENQEVLQKLKLSNEKLKALDEAKDEFISMASHQLRTPLTSVKGYVSMVLDGDVGQVPKPQKDLLEQAFASSQRMVYLIADLLNVSRLKTGKFIIDSAPTSLPEVVESEIGQLVETAKVHKLELTYKKPDKFPVINLDETKTRQVIMNFIDNAIYYTPAGGHIRVELTNTDKTVEFKVIDDGLGVPKAEQPHLFTKFFRAGNAKKARPDGTGLGLFMAKKVIVAQGGALIFNSEEGKGSTFGFSFPLHALEVKKTS